MIKHPEPKAACGVKDLSHFTISRPHAIIEEVRGGTQGNNLETENMDQLCIFTCLLNHDQLAFFYNSGLVAWGWSCL